MPLWRIGIPLLLASRSRPRRAMLEAAGIPIEVHLPDLNERAVEDAAGSRAPVEVARLLASEKAKAVSRHRSGRIVVGADQTLALGNRRFNKPTDLGVARAQLALLAGKTHELHSAVAVARDGEVVFDAIDTASLTMRPLSPAFIDTYLEEVGGDALESVGAYQLERLGIHLFDRIEGNHFTILGLPLLKLLEFLRHDGCLES